MRKNSLVWRFFDRVETGRSICTSVICKLCEAEYKFFGNTTNLRVHLSRKHPIQWELAHDDPSISFTSEEGSAGQIGKKRRKIKIDMDDDDTDTIIQEDGDTILIKASDRPDEEWLEELYDKIDYQPKALKIKRRIKREVESDTDYYTEANTPLKPEHEPETKDECSAFGEYIATKLRKLKTARTRGNIQQIITTVLWQAEYGVYDNADTVRNLIFSFSPNINIDMGENSAPDDSIQVEMVNNESEQYNN